MQDIEDQAQEWAELALARQICIYRVSPFSRLIGLEARDHGG